jgi:cytochrome c5
LKLARDAMNVGNALASCLAAAVLVAVGAARAQEPTDATPYTVECGPDPDEGGATVCRVDRGTYVGWRTFHAICHTCHAQDAVGSTFAPDLLARMRQIGKPEFMKAMNEGFTGQMGVMPPWKQDPNVNKYFEELWSFLKARSDGALLPGRPKRLPAEP